MEKLCTNCNNNSNDSSKTCDNCVNKSEWTPFVDNETVKACQNCNYLLIDDNVSPCVDCEGKNNWTPIRALETIDNVNKPAHYCQGNIETIDYLQSCLTTEEFKGFLKGNIIKYTSRERLKGGLEDIKKAEWYKNKLIQVMEDKPNGK